MALIITRTNRQGKNAFVLHTADGDIEVTLTEVRGGQARVVINAPPTVTILRKELLDRQSMEN